MYVKKINPFFPRHSWGLRGSILKSRIINSAATAPELKISGSLVMFRIVPAIINKAPISSRIRSFLFKNFLPFNLPYWDLEFSNYSFKPLKYALIPYH
ncbi:predicted protein [Methanosarcina acetivorans C2A]|uniref:Uncharacterized protein n=1 Tax=Methanosarcina acetivorans (strain ATCC 35395 / DSM 2834 / JCM 12185 / C2A) TaxID=188937 RepID=Q8TKR7_METAC|nr:predicted protein [Methanosarcina acetivorans C2A]